MGVLLRIMLLVYTCFSCVRALFLRAVSGLIAVGRVLCYWPALSPTRPALPRPVPLRPASPQPCHDVPCYAMPSPSPCPAPCPALPCPARQAEDILALLEAEGQSVDRVLERLLRQGSGSGGGAPLLLVRSIDDDDNGGAKGGAGGKAEGKGGRGAAGGG